MSSFPETVESAQSPVIPKSNPLVMNRPPYYRIPVSHIENNDTFSYLPIKDHLAEMIKIISNVHGAPTDYCVLAGNIIGVGNWSKLTVEDQHHYVTERAGAFVASGMLYLRITGNDAVDFLNYLTPRDVSKMPVNSALFVLFTSHDGGVDEEAVILRLSETDFLMSCGGGKAPSFVHEALSLFPNVAVRDVDTVSFNIKGPLRREAMGRLIADEDKNQVFGLDEFTFCTVKTVHGDDVHVARTIIGMEMWGDSSSISRVWSVLLNETDIIIPCGWDLLETYRMECRDICFALHPLDMNYGTTLGDLGMAWMFDRQKDSEFIGKRALKQNLGADTYKLVKIYADSELNSSPDIGQRIYCKKGEECGYVTSYGYSYKYNRYVAFAHILRDSSVNDVIYTENQNVWRINLDPQQLERLLNTESIERPVNTHDFDSLPQHQSVH